MVHILEMVFSGRFPGAGAGDGLLEGNSCFARELPLAGGRDDWLAAEAFLASAAFLNMVW